MTVPRLPLWLRLRCPNCAGPIWETDDDFRCAMGHIFPVRHGIPYLFPDDLPPPSHAYVRWVHDYYRVPFSPRQRQKTARLVDVFLRLTRPAPPVLEVGCGRADKAHLFADGGYVGLDPIDPIAAGMVASLPAPMVCGRGERLPFEGGQFNSVVLYAVLDHVRDRSSLFRQCAHVLRDGGALCVLNQVVAARGSRLRGLVSWIASMLRSGDLTGILAIFRFSFANPRVRRYLEPLTVDQIAREVGEHFRAVEPTVIDGHVLILRAPK